MKIITYLKNKIQLEYVYFAIALLWGSILVFLIPPFQAPDEPAHYFRAIGIMHGQFKCREHNAYDIPQKVYDFERAMNVYNIAQHPDKTFDRDLISQYKDSTNEGTKTILMPLCYSFSIPHIIPGTVLRIGSFLGLNLLHAFYLARFVNLFLAVFITAYAIRIIPVAKHVLFLLGLLPMTIFQYAVISYDAFFIPMIFLFVAYCLHLYKKQKILQTKEKIVLIILSIFGTIVKLGYQPLLLLPLILMPKEKTHRKKFFIYIGIVWAVNISLLILQKILLPADFDFFEGVDASAQVQYVITHPFSYVLIIVRTIYHSLSFYGKGYLGNFGWLDYTLPNWGYFLIAGSGIAFVLLENVKTVLNLRTRLILLSSFLLTSLLIFTSLYVINTQVKDEVIIGVQGRYFIGISLPLFISLRANNFSIQNATTRRILYILLVISLVFIIFSTLYETNIRYYG